MSVIDEQQLIELIEGELAGADAEKLRAQLISQDAALAAKVAAMQHDRQALRSLPPVDPPIDFLAELEPMIARPMLMDDVPGAASAPIIVTKPGTARRAAHRQQRRAQLLPAAIAAGIVIVLSGGLWYTLTQIGVFNSEHSIATNTNGDASSESRLTANSSTAGNSSNTVAASQIEITNMLASGELHHKLPPLDDMQSVAALPTRVALAEVDADLPEFSLNNPPQFVLADFELVIRTGRDDDPQNVLARAIEPLAGRAAVVRNLTTANLKIIESAWLASRAESGNASEPARASMNNTKPQTGGDPIKSGRRALPALNADMLRDSADKLIESGLVAGEPALMPLYSTQIELSEAGSVYTIVLPARDLQVMLERLAAVRGVDSAMLTMRADPNAAAKTSAANAARWVSDLSRVQQSWEKLASEQPDAVVVLPIVIGAAK